MRRQRCRWIVAAIVGLVLATSCAGDEGDDPRPAAAERTEETDGPGEGEEPADAEPEDAETGDDDAPPGLDVDPATCPAGFEDGPLEAGTHADFEVADQAREFHLLLPSDAAGPRPLMVALTGTVQEERAFLEQSRLDELAEHGWIVVAPVRNGNGLLWEPWDAMRLPDHADIENPDHVFIEELVRCIAAHHDVDATRVFASGISIGGTMVNLVLRQSSDLFAGGIVGSGNFVLTAPPDPEPLEDMTVIVAWGGPEDRWAGCPDGRMGDEVADEPGCVDISFVDDAAAASQFYDGERAVRQVACSADVGHIWIADGTAYMAEVLEANPKGSGDEAVLPPGEPGELSCSTEAFTG